VHSGKHGIASARASPAATATLWPRLSKREKKPAYSDIADMEEILDKFFPSFAKGERFVLKLKKAYALGLLSEGQVTEERQPMEPPGGQGRAPLFGSLAVQSFRLRGCC